MCAPVPPAPGADYDVWQAYTIKLLAAYGNCAARHRETVEAWPK